MISGRSLDASALVAFAAERSVCAAALVWTAAEENITLAVPSTAIAAARSRLDDSHRPILDVLLHLPVTVVDTLDADRARRVELLGGTQLDAHAVACARERGWPLVTDDADRYKVFGELELEPLP